MSKPSNSLDVLDWLRFPLALAVVFIHSFGSIPQHPDIVCRDPLSAAAVYDIVRVLFSKVLPGFAVPLFFLISGYLFFRGMESWDWSRYGQKLRRRVHTLLIPYVVWNILHCIHLSWPTLLKLYSGKTTVDALFAMWGRWGGIRMLWDGHLVQPVPTNILGVDMPFSAPVLVPLWFLRDLMVVVLFAPLLYWLIRRFGRWVVLFFGGCFIFNVWIPLPGLSSTSTFWFALGAFYSLRQIELVESCSRQRLWAYPLAVLLLVCLVAWRTTVSEPNDLWLRVVNSLYVIASSVSVVALASSLMCRGWIRVRPWLVSSTFFIYVSHIFMRKQVLHTFALFHVKSTYPYLTIQYLLVPLLTAALCVALYQIYRHFRLLNKKGSSKKCVDRIK